MLASAPPRAEPYLHVEAPNEVRRQHRRIGFDQTDLSSEHSSSRHSAHSARLVYLLLTACHKVLQLKVSHSLASTASAIADNPAESRVERHLMRQRGAG